MIHVWVQKGVWLHGLILSHASSPSRWQSLWLTKESWLELHLKPMLVSTEKKMKCFIQDILLKNPRSFGLIAYKEFADLWLFYQQPVEFQHQRIKIFPNKYPTNETIYFLVGDLHASFVITQKNLHPFKCEAFFPE